jgi:hypothetical protein
MNFHGRDNVLAETKMTKKDLKDGRQIDISEAQRKLNIRFRFAPPNAPHFQGLVERIEGAAKAALRPTLRTALVSSKVLHNNWIAETRGVKEDRAFRPRVWTPRHSNRTKNTGLSPSTDIAEQ